MKFRQSKGDNSYITDDTLMKLHLHNHTMVLYIQYKFHEIPFISYLVMVEIGEKIKFRQSKGNNSAITYDTPIKLHVHNLTMVIYIQYKFHEIPSIGYLVMAEDGRMDSRADIQCQTNILPPSAGDT